MHPAGLYQHSRCGQPGRGEDAVENKPGYFQLDDGADVAAHVPAAALGRMRPDRNVDESHILQYHLCLIQDPGKL